MALDIACNSGLCRFVALAVMSLACWSVAFATNQPAHAQRPATRVADRTPITYKDLKLLGAYRLNGRKTADGCRLGYSAGKIAWGEDGRIWVSGNVNNCWHYAPFELPAEEPSLDVENAPAAVQVDDWRDITEGKRPHKAVLGALRIDGQWLWTSHDNYNADQSHDPCIGYGGKGPWRTLAHTQLTAGYLAEIPEDFRAAFGCRIFCGLAEHSTRQLGSYGPAFVSLGFDPARIPPPQGVLDTQVLEQVPLTEVETASGERRWEASVGGAAFVDTGKKAGVIFAGRYGYGRIWYGNQKGPDGLIDPCNSSRGRHAEKYAAAIWIYDPTDLLAVRDGRKNPLQITAREFVKLDELLPGTNCQGLGGIVYDADKRRIYVSAPNRQRKPEPQPLLYVFEVQ